MNKWTMSLLLALIIAVILWKTHLLGYANVIVMLVITHLWLVALAVIISLPILLVLRLFIKEDKKQ